MAQSVRVVLAVSSPLKAKALERLLENASDIEVAAIARRGQELLTLVSAAHPQVLCIDDSPPAIDALALVRETMRVHPCPILVLSDTTDARKRQELLAEGALEVSASPSVVGVPDKATTQQFAAKLKMLARVPVIGRRSSSQTMAPASSVAPTRPFSATTTPSSAAAVAPPTTGASGQIVAIGASTGGPVALMTVLSALPATYPHPIVCVQHVSKGFLEGLVTWLDQGCRLRVILAQMGEFARAGTILFPPEDRHLEIGSGGRIRLSDAPPRDGHRPSATVLFESVAVSYGSRTTAVLLTGMGADGASGLAAVHDAGGDTIAQNEASCVVYGMPRVAIERGAAKHIGSPEDIAKRLLSLGEG